MCRFDKPIITTTDCESLILQRVKGLQKIPKIIPTDVVWQQDWVIATRTLYIRVANVGLGKLEHPFEE